MAPSRARTIRLAVTSVSTPGSLPSLSPECRPMAIRERGLYPYDLPRISYAQNHEDILIDRLFRGQIGTFVDIGACHPVVDSNTRFFYERGWRGVNFEPSFSSFQLFLDHRPEDLNLNMAVSDFDGELTFYEVEDHVINGTSTLSAEIAEGYRQRGFDVAERRVPVRTIRSLIDTHGIEPPDLLSIDVEAHEAAVIRGTPLDSWRPRVLVVEATLPGTTTPSHQDWEPILLAHGYLFAAFNGLNRFYLREDLRDWLGRLATPVHVLDHFVPHEVLVQHERAADFQRQLACVQERMAVERHQHEEIHRAWEQEQAAWEQERRATDRERADWQARLTAFAADRVEWARQRSALEQQSACLQGQLEATQRQLRHYRLLDGLGMVSVGYGWARKLKHRLVP